MRLTRQASERVQAPAAAVRHGVRGRASAILLAAITAVLLALAAGPTAADEYDEDLAGHPLRIVAYVLHPVGVALDYLILRPAHWIASHEPFQTLFGHEED